MGNFIYEGDHSIKFLRNGVLFDTWEDFHMAPKSRPFVAEPSVKSNYIDVPGADGSLDYTEALTGSVLYGMRTGQWDFIVDLPYEVSSKLATATGMNVTNAIAFQSAILKFFHGRKFDQIILTDEYEYDRKGNLVSGYFYTGRITAKTSLATKDYIQITLQYNLNPYKYPLNSTKMLDWKWNELFGNTIKYGKFSVSDKTYGKVRTIYLDEVQSVTINVTNPMDMVLGAQTFHLSTGDNVVAASNWNVGGNKCTFFGYGLVTVDYSEGRTL